MQWYAAATGKRGRRQVFSDAAIQFCLSIKSLFGLALRQSLGLVESVLRLAGLPWRVPNFSTVCRSQNHLAVQLAYRRSTTALDLLVDSTGIKFLGEGEWKLGRRIWKKWSGYHRRSLVETKMHCFKRLGERVMACTFERQVTELHKWFYFGSITDKNRLRANKYQRF